MISLRHPEPVQAMVSCRGERHRLEYRAGELQALDHDDVDGELTLSALGGEAAVCAELVDAWRRNCTDLRVLVLASHGASDQLADLPQAEPAPHGSRRGRVPRGAVAGMAMPAVYTGWSSGGGFSSSYASTVHFGTMNASDGEPALDPLVRLLTLNRAIAHRLTATVIRTWTEKLERGEVSPDLPALRVALIGRAQGAFAEWATKPGEDIEVVMLPPGSQASVTGSDRLRIGLPFSWLADVWSPGLSHLLGRFTLAADEVGDAIHLDTLDASMVRSRLVVASG